MLRKLSLRQKKSGFLMKREMLRAHHMSALMLNLRAIIQLLQSIELMIPLFLYDYNISRKFFSSKIG